MSDGSISQDEIDALLSGMDMGGSVPAEMSSSKPVVSDFRGKAFDTFLAQPTRMFAQNLSSMTGDEAKVNSITYSNIDREGFMQMLPEVTVVTTCDYASTLQGDHIFVMPQDMVSKIVALVNREDKVEIDDMALSIVSEIVGQYLSSQITELDNIGITGVSNNPPESMSIPKAMIRLPQKTFMCIEYSTKVNGGNYTFWEIITDGTATKIAETINGGQDPASIPQQKSGMPQQPQTSTVDTMNSFTNQSMPSGQGDFTGGINMSNFGEPQNMQGTGINPTVQPVAFPPLQNFGGAENKSNIGLIMDVYMELTVELGRTKKTVKEILGMGEGHIISLDKLAGESVDILVNHKPIAKGEVVVIEENFGVRVTEILSQSERVNNLTN
ncbi:MAG: flagellar motor switch protein FliN [Spirochaetaceae bacterium]|nr:flagellar motor switch protein FliN [Spirochaetaceae bacterium]